MAEGFCIEFPSTNRRSVACRSLVDCERANMWALCCYLATQVQLIHSWVCESLHQKNTAACCAVMTTRRLSDDVLSHFQQVKPVFEHLKQVVVIV